MADNQNPARTQAAANTRELIRWATEAISKPLPEPVRRRAATILSDDIGAMVAGSLEPQGARAPGGRGSRALVRAGRAPQRGQPRPPCSRGVLRAPTGFRQPAQMAWQSPGANST